MKLKIPKRRKRVLKKLHRKFSRLNLSIFVVLVVALPFLTVGTQYHSSTIAMRNGVLIGGFLSTYIVKWSRFSYRKCLRVSKDKAFYIHRLLYNAYLLAGGLLLGAAMHIGVRLLNHKGSWDVTLSASWMEIGLFLSMGVFMSMMAGALYEAVTVYKYEESISFKAVQTPLSFLMFVMTPAVVVIAFILSMVLVPWLKGEFSFQEVNESIRLLIERTFPVFHVSGDS